MHDFANDDRANCQSLHPTFTQEGVQPSPEQEPAVTTRGRDVVVTARAGAG